MAPLKLLGLFIGGYMFREDLFGKMHRISTSNEWAGLLGMWWNFLWTSYPWISFIPILFLTLLVLSAKAMMEGLTNVLRETDSMTEAAVNRTEIQYSQISHPFERIKISNK